MAKVARVKDKWFVQGAKGWEDEKGEPAIVPAEHHTKFYPTEEAAAKDGFKVKTAPKAITPAPEVKK